MLRTVEISFALGSDQEGRHGSALEVRRRHQKYFLHLRFQVNSEVIQAEAPHVVCKHARIASSMQHILFCTCIIKTRNVHKRSSLLFPAETKSSRSASSGSAASGSPPSFSSTGGCSWHDATTSMGWLRSILSRIGGPSSSCCSPQSSFTFFSAGPAERGITIVWLCVM